MVAHFHAQIWNGSEIARSLAIGATSVTRYLDLLDVDDHADLLNHPKVGASWEGFALQQVASILELRR